MQTSMSLLKKRRFLPLFVTQLLGAFNDNLFKNAMVLFVVYGVYQDPTSETIFSGVASALFIIPFIALSAVSGQLADARDKAAIIRIVKAAEIVIMSAGGAGSTAICTTVRRSGVIGITGTPAVAAMSLAAASSADDAVRRVALLAARCRIVGADSAESV